MPSFAVNNPRFKVWISKYALSRGVFEIDAEHCIDISENMVTDTAASRLIAYHLPYWHLTRGEAEAHAAVMRDKRIASLEKQIRKLRKMTFEAK